VTHSIVLDANVLIAYLDGNHPHHGRAVDLIATTSAALFVNALTLAEVLVGAVAAGVEQQVLAAITDDAAIAVVDGSGHDWALHLATARARSVPRLRMPDAVVLASALSVRGDVATFDDRLARAADALGCRLPL
jgi:predicted nucleic acid-binding protein